MKILSYEQYLSNPFLTRKRVNSKGLASISVRISISGDKAEFSSLQFVYSPNLGLSSALELFTPEIYREEVKSKKMDKGVEE